MPDSARSLDLEAELARARELLAAGRHPEALKLALKLLEQVLETLRQRLTVLHHELAQAKNPAGTPPDENRVEHSVCRKINRRHYH